MTTQNWFYPDIIKAEVIIIFKEQAVKHGGLQIESE